MNTSLQLSFEDMRFDGADYKQGRDQKRLSGQLLRVYTYMADQRWHTLKEIAQETGDPEASISAQLRNLRKKEGGNHSIKKRYILQGLYEYQLTPNEYAFKQVKITIS